MEQRIIDINKQIKIVHVFIIGLISIGFDPFMVNSYGYNLFWQWVIQRYAMYVTNLISSLFWMATV